MRTRRYGWVRDLPDHRDMMFGLPLVRQKAPLPPSVDLRPGCPSVYDQGELGSCTANAIGAAHQFEQIKQKNPDVFNPSRLFIYYNERFMENTVYSDSGAQIRDGIKSVAKQGVCSEVSWPYDIPVFSKRPSDVCYTEAAKHQVTSYLRLNQDLKTMKQCLAAGYPFVFGFSVYESFETDAVAKTGIVPMPYNAERILGGHAVMCVGYDDSKQLFTVRNSWGTDWGDVGHCYMPYSYLTGVSLACDFWTIRLVEDEA